MGEVIPELSALISGHAVRVPVPNVSCIDLVVDLAKSVDADEINIALKIASEGPLEGIWDTTDRQQVSADFHQNRHSAIVASDQSRVQGRMARVLAWYDNEWGIVQRMIDVSRLYGTV